MPIRQPIVCVLGHVDTGKTSLLDRIRKTSVQAREVGGITQHIGASFFPVETLKQLCGSLLARFKSEVEIPGLLIVDTPGHEVFTNLRKRGGSVADIAILVIDVMHGFEAQTYESLDILRSRRTPFLVAANKIDRVNGWKPCPGEMFLEAYRRQDAFVREDLDNRLYEMMGVFSRIGRNADRFDKVTDFTKTVAIVPTSAKTGEGVMELLAVLVGLTQQHLKKHLQASKGPAKGTVLEVKEESGLGLTLNTIVYDGVLRKDDLIVVGGKEKPVVTRIRAILVPKPLDEIRDPRDRFSAVEAVSAAAGVKIVAPDLEGALSGAPLYAVGKGESAKHYEQLVSEEIDRIRIATDTDGVVVKADTLGSLEAMADILRKQDVPIRLADIGDVSKRDVVEAAVVKEHEPIYGAVLAFGVRVLPDAEEEARVKGVQIFLDKVIYHVIDNYVSWSKGLREAELGRSFDALTKPAKIIVLSGYIFRRAKPAIFGIEVLAGRLKPKSVLMRAEDSDEIGDVQQIQDKGKAIAEATKGMQVAVSMDKPVVGRHVFEKDLLYVKVPEPHAKALLSTFIDRLTEDEREALNEFVELMRKKSPFWAA
ncbi:MAG: translation initiation factor IF-2 [Candidatus Bathyarchaeota archaeon]|nr:translation initiation factor IF-2 [Candidatus Bathyarchaeota archaeon]